MVFHAKAVEVYSSAFQSLDSYDLERDLEVGTPQMPHLPVGGTGLRLCLLLVILIGAIFIGSILRLLQFRRLVLMNSFLYLPPAAKTRGGEFSQFYLSGISTFSP